MSERHHNPNRWMVRRELLKLAVTGGCAVGGLLAGSNLLAGTRALPRAEQSPDLESGSEQYASGDKKISAYFAKPKSGTKLPAILVVQDSTPFAGFEGAARHFATQGFAVLAPDLGSTEAGKSIEGLSPSDTVDDLKAGYDYLSQHANVDSARVSVAGFGWGGWRAWMIAEQTQNLHRAVVFDGISPTDGLEEIQAPVLAHYAQFDYTDVSNAVWTHKTLEAAGKKFTYYVYPKTSKGFYLEGTSSYDPDAAKLVWQRTLEFLASS
jgi:carboxymethylenebutenolidase